MQNDPLQAFDQWLSKPVPKADPFFAERLRSRIRRQQRRQRSAAIVSWLRPIAAAALIGVSFAAFQLQTDPQSPSTPSAAQVNIDRAAATVDPELETIFALASTMPQHADLAAIADSKAVALFLQ
jgi:hypothetical protein